MTVIESLIVIKPKTTRSYWRWIYTYLRL